MKDSHRKVYPDKSNWRKLEELLPNKDKNSTICLVDENSGQPIAHEKTGEHINNYFIGIGPKFAAKFNTPWTYSGTTTNIIIQDLIISPEIVFNTARFINTRKASAIPYINARIIKDAMLAIPDKFSFLFNLSLTQAKFPSKWKQALVTPLTKPGDKALVLTSHPI